jgi:hypothetical protein
LEQGSSVKALDLDAAMSEPDDYDIVGAPFYTFEQSIETLRYWSSLI